MPNFKFGVVRTSGSLYYYNFIPFIFTDAFPALAAISAPTIEVMVTQPPKELIYYLVHRTFRFSINSVNFPPLKFFLNKLVFPHNALSSSHISNARCDNPFVYAVC